MIIKKRGSGWQCNYSISDRTNGLLIVLKSLHFTSLQVKEKKIEKYFVFYIYMRKQCVQALIYVFVCAVGSIGCHDWGIRKCIFFFFSVFVSLSFLPLCLKIHCIVCCCISPPVGLQSEALHSTAATPPYLAASINADFNRRVFCPSHTPPGSRELQRLAWVWRPSLVYNAYHRSNSVIQQKAWRDCRWRSRTVLALSCIL